jgi:hypothetical protein
MKCDEFKKLNWKEDKTKREDAEKHFLECNECRLYQGEYESIIRIIRNETRDKIAENELNIYQRIKPIIEKEKFERTGYRKGIIFKPNYALKWALPMAASLLLVFVLIFGMQLISPDRADMKANANVNIVSMVDTPQGVLVKWHDAKKSEYILIRSTDPKGVKNAVKIKVKGNCYLDKEAENYPIVYYKVL